MTTFETLVAEAGRVGWPEAFREDLTKHDRNRLEHSDDPPPAFGWVLRKCGTLLLDARMQGKHRRDYVAHIKTSDGSPDPHRCYFWDGVSLQAVEPERMAELMAPHAEEKTEHNGY